MMKKVKMTREQQSGPDAYIAKKIVHVLELKEDSQELLFSYTHESIKIDIDSVFSFVEFLRDHNHYIPYAYHRTLNTEGKNTIYTRVTILMHQTLVALIKELSIPVKHYASLNVLLTRVADMINPAMEYEYLAMLIDKKNRFCGYVYQKNQHAFISLYDHTRKLYKSAA